MQQQASCFVPQLLCDDKTCLARPLKLHHLRLQKSGMLSESALLADVHASSCWQLLMLTIVVNAALCCDRCNFSASFAAGSTFMQSQLWPELP
jgi:hypothetical protein